MFSKKQMAKKGGLMAIFAAIGAFLGGEAEKHAPGSAEAVAGVVVGGLTALQNWLKQKAKS